MPLSRSSADGFIASLSGIRGGIRAADSRTPTKPIAVARRNAAEAGSCPFEISSAEDRYQREPAHTETPERIFERRWALSVLDRVMDRLRAECIQHGRLDHFNRLKPFLLDRAEAPYAALAREMGTSEGALKVAIHRAPQTVSRPLPAGDRGDNGRCGRSRIRTPVSGGSAEVVATARGRKDVTLEA
jgi:hypothetical protein